MLKQHFACELSEDTHFIPVYCAGASLHTGTGMTSVTGTVYPVRLWLAQYGIWHKKEWIDTSQPLSIPVPAAVLVHDFTTSWLLLRHKNAATLKWHAQNHELARNTQHGPQHGHYLYLCISAHHRCNRDGTCRSSCVASVYSGHGCHSHVCRESRHRIAHRAAGAQLYGNHRYKQTNTVMITTLRHRSTFANSLAWSN